MFSSCSVSWTVIVLAAWPLSDGFSLADLKKAIDNEATAELQNLLQESDAKKVINTMPDGNDFMFPGYSGLHYACLKGRTKHVKMLLEAGADKDLATPSKVTPLQVASANKNPKSVRALLKAGAKASAVSVSGMNGVTMAARSGDLEVLHEYRAAGGEAMLTLGSPDEQGFSAMKFAVQNGRADILRFLLFEVGFGTVDAKEIKSMVTEKVQEGKIPEDLAKVVDEVSKAKGEALGRERMAYFQAQESELRAKKASKTAKSEL